MTRFELYYDGKTVKGDTLQGDKDPINLLFLHGAGTANKNRFAPLCKALYTTFGTASIAFDFIGLGLLGSGVFGLFVVVAFYILELF